MLLPWATGTGSVFRLRPGRISIHRIYTYNAQPAIIFPFTLRRIHSEGSSKPPAPSESPEPPKEGEKKPDLPESLKENKYDISSFAVDLNAWRERFRERANEITSNARLSLSELGGRLNQITGYEHIERLKHKVTIAAKRQAARDAKVAYETAVATRAQSQRDVNDLLQRKSSWTASDVERFTALVREDHLHEQEETRSKTQVELAEADVDSEFNELMRTILNRYHEEQVWSDKIRSASTYGSMLVLGVNVFVFLLAIIIVEPWKRRKLAETFEKRIEQISEENRKMIQDGMSNLSAHFEKQEQVLAVVADQVWRNEPASIIPTIISQQPPPQIEGPLEELAISTPLRLLERTAKAVRDRDVLIAGAVGAVGGVAITLLSSYFK
ncbi:hypothetical protein M422DRAFT_153193 [Sphaerobolus stellatus SS14]|nr:hypothetical protein M422DRAFT_153193 [Sphaerobolus stellatus SS14]